MKLLLLSILAPLCVACSPNSASGNQIPKQPHLVLEKTGEINRYGNPILKVSMFENGTLKGSVKAVSGRGWTQGKSRNVAGTQAPLPDGVYEVNPTIFHVNSHPELGSQFVDVYPTFPTGRSELGFHLDPSFNRDPVKDGTSGCIGLVDSQQRDTLFRFITRTQTKQLFVRIQ
jgi:hypothetical protein